MKPGDLFRAKAGAVLVTLIETGGKWSIEHHERLKNGNVRGVAFYGATQSEVMDKLFRSKRSLPKDAVIQFEHRTIGGDEA